MTPQDSQDLATVAPAGVPALQRDASRQLTASDIAWPRLYLGQAISNAVQDGNVKVGELFIAADGDDPDPQVVAPAGEDHDGLRFYVLDLRKGISRTTEDGDLDTWVFGDPDAPEPSWQTGAWITYSYTLAIPAIDEQVPIRFLLSRSGQPAAKKINGVIIRTQETQPSWQSAFSLKTAERANKAGKRYWVARVQPVDPTDAGLAVAEKLANLVQANSPAFADATVAEPAI